MNEDNDNEKESEILTIYDVYLTSSLSDSLCTFRYPLRPKNRPYRFHSIQKVEVKPKLDIVKIDYDIPGDDNYSSSSVVLDRKTRKKKRRKKKKSKKDDYYDFGRPKGTSEEIPDIEYEPKKKKKKKRVFTDTDDEVEEDIEKGKVSEDTEEDDDVIMLDEEDVNTFTLRSEKNTLRCNYCVAVKRENQIHLTPIKTILTFKPDLMKYGKTKHINIEKEKRESEKSTKKKRVLNMRLTPEEEMKKKKLFQNVKLNEDLEDWVKFKALPKEDDYSIGSFEGLFHDSMGDLPSKSIRKKDDFYKDVFPNVEPNVPNSELTLVDIMKLTHNIEEQICWILKNIHVISYRYLKEVLNTGKDDKTILKFVLKYGRLINEKELVFVSKSELYKSELDEKCIVTRDYLLCLFYRDSHVSRKDFLKQIDSVAVGVSQETVNEFFNKIGVLNTENRVYEVKSFENHYLTEGEKIVVDLLNIFESERVEWDSLYSIVLPVIQSKFRIIAKRMNVHYLSTSGTNEENVKKKKLIEFFYKEFKCYGVLTFQVLKEHFLEWQKNVPILKKISEKEFKTFFESISRQLKEGCYILKMKSKNTEFETLRNGMIDIILEKPDGIDKQVLLDKTCQRLNIKKENIKATDFLSVCREVAIYKNNMWITKNGNPSTTVKDLFKKDLEKSKTTKKKSDVKGKKKAKRKRKKKK